MLSKGDLRKYCRKVFQKSQPSPAAKARVRSKGMGESAALLPVLGSNNILCQKEGETVVSRPLVDINRYIGCLYGRSPPPRPWKGHGQS